MFNAVPTHQGGSGATETWRLSRLGDTLSSQIHRAERVSSGQRRAVGTTVAKGLIQVRARQGQEAPNLWNLWVLSGPGPLHPRERAWGWGRGEHQMEMWAQLREDRLRPEGTTFGLTMATPVHVYTKFYPALSHTHTNSFHPHNLKNVLPSSLLPSLPHFFPPSLPPTALLPPLFFPSILLSKQQHKCRL